MPEVPPNVAIRRIGVDELSIVQQLAEEVWPHAFEGVIQRHQIEIMLGDIYALESLENEMTALGHLFWVARHEGLDSGFVSAFKRGDTTWIKKLYILPRKQGIGIGRALIETAVTHFAPSKAISLNVNNGNARAIEFYKKYGFAIAEEVPVKMGPFDFTDYVMTKAL
ncbi:GNAT family N-acetyltransferase [Devosia sp.]|uniref:GNAT family N-acetyltransferase n=1 Tax=Devosia sp. TaxID=1871048 RepID=UPI0037BF7D6D